MRIDEIRSPGFLSNSHALRKEMIRAISFCQIQCSESKQEKLTDLVLFLNEALALCNAELDDDEDEVKPEPVEPVMTYSHYTALLPAPEVAHVKPKGSAKGKAAR